jgi:hypothetical protein
MDNFYLSKKFHIINETQTNNNICKNLNEEELIKYHSASMPDYEKSINRYAGEYNLENIRISNKTDKINYTKSNNDDTCYIESKNNIQKVNYDQPFNTKIWYNHYRGYIVRSYLDPLTNKIIQEKIKYN